MQNDPTTPESLRVWPQVRRFLVFQIKLYLDAVRDVLFSFLAIGALLLDLVQQNHGNESVFAKLLRLGRRSESMINLFNEYDGSAGSEVNVDSLINEVEERLRR